MAFLDYSGLSHFLDKIKTIFIPVSQKGANNGVATLDNTGKIPETQIDFSEIDAELALRLKSVNDIPGDEYGNVVINEVEFAHQIVTDEAQQSAGEYLYRTTGGDASLSDGPAKLVSIQGRMDHSGASNAIVVSNPQKFISTGWNLYNHTNGYARVLKYSDTYGFIVEGTYTSIKFAETTDGEQTTIVPDQDGNFTIPSDGYVFIGGGNTTDTAIYMTWSDWTEGHDGEFAAYTESIVDFSSVMAERFPYGLMQVDNVYDEINISANKAISRIERMANTTVNMEAAVASGRAFDYDSTYIYIVRETPEEYSISISGDHIACDHGYEIIYGGTVPVYVQTMYGDNLVDKLRHDIPEQITELQNRTINNQKADANGNWEINEVPYAANLTASDAQASYGEFVTRTTGGDASISDGDAWLNTIQGNMIHDGYSARSVRMTVEPVQSVPRVGTITASIDRVTFITAVGNSGVYEFNYSTAWNPDVSSYGITVTGTPIYGDKITVSYSEEEIDMTVNAVTRPTPAGFSATLDTDDFCEYTAAAGTYTTSYTDMWSIDPSDMGLTVTGTPKDGDSISVVYDGTNTPSVYVSSTPISVYAFDDGAFYQHVAAPGSYTVSYTNAWSTNPALYGLTVSGTPKSGDSITVEYNGTDSPTATVYSTPITISVDNATFLQYVSNTPGTYTMEYGSGGWDTNPALYGVTVSGTPKNGDVITITYDGASDPESEVTTTPITCTLNASVFYEYVAPAYTYIMSFTDSWDENPALYGVTISGTPKNGDSVIIVYDGSNTPTPAVSSVQITASLNASAFYMYASGDGTYVFSYTTSWSADPALYGLTVTGTPINGDSITVVHYGGSSFETIVSSPRTPDAPITADIDKSTFRSYVADSGTTTLSYTDSWSANPALYGITVTGTPLDGDSIVIVYSKESIVTTVDPVSEVQRENPITAVIDEEVYDASVQTDGTTVFTYTNAWSTDPAEHGITVTNTPVSGDTITVVCMKERRGTITVFDPTEFYSTNWNLYNNSLGYARVLKYRTVASFIIGGTFTAVSFSTSNDPSSEKTPISLVDMGDGKYYFEVEEDGFAWVTGGNTTDTYIHMTWSDWTEGHAGDFAVHSASVIDLSTIMSTYFPYGLLRVGNVYDEINISVQAAYSRIDRMSYSAANLAIAKASDMPYEYDTNYIYIVKETPSSNLITIDGLYAANDHGLEVFRGTFVPGYAQMLYGQNLKDKLRTDVVTISGMDLNSSQKNQVRNNIGAVGSVNGKTPNSSGAVTLQPSDLGLTPATLRDVPFAIATSAWSSVTGGFSATFTTSYVTSTSKEIATFDSSMRSYSKADISVAKQSGGGGMVFTTSVKPTGTISGTLFVMDNDDGQVPVLIEDTVVPVTKGGTGQSSLEGAKSALGVTAVEEKITTKQAPSNTTIAYLVGQTSATNVTTRWYISSPSTVSDWPSVFADYKTSYPIIEITNYGTVGSIRLYGQTSSGIPGLLVGHYVNSTIYWDSLNNVALYNKIAKQQSSKSYNTGATLAGIQSDAEALAGDDNGVFNVGYVYTSGATTVGLPSGAYHVVLIKHTADRMILEFVKLDDCKIYYNSKVTTWSNDILYPVVDDLTSTDATKPLSAKQGKVLNDKFSGLYHMTTTYTSDLDNAPDGFVITTTGVTNTPTTNAAWFVETISYSNSIAVQIATNRTRGTQYTRYKNSGTWGDWIDTNSLLYDKTIYQGDLNSAPPGWVYTDSPGNRPDTNSNWYVLTIVNSSSQGVQFAVARGTTKYYFRTRTGGTWGGWYKLAMDGDVVPGYQAGTYSNVGFNGAYGFITNTAKNLYLTLPLLLPPNRTITLANVTLVKIGLRTAAGGYLGGADQKDVTSYLSDIQIKKEQGTVDLVLVNNDGWGVTNNTPAIGRATVSFTVT